MRPRFRHRVIAFLLTAAFLWCFYRTVVQRSQRRAGEEILAEEEYRKLRDYIEENNLHYRKIQRICSAADTSEDTPLIDYFAMAMMCALTIIPYSILLALIRRLADRFPGSDAVSKRDRTSEEYLE